MDIRFEGLREFDRALGRADKTLRKGLRTELKETAGIVATEARMIAAAKGLRQSGDLIRGIRPFANARGAGVRSSARHRGYPYPRRLEFGSGRARASLLPALEAKKGVVRAKAEHLLDRIAKDLTR